MTYPNVYEIAPGRYAYGVQGQRAAAVIERVTTGPGRPKYRGVRGRRPVIDKRFKRIAPSDLILRELDRVSGHVFN